MILEASFIRHPFAGCTIGDLLEEDWRNLSQLSALKSKFVHANMLTCMCSLGNIGELLDNYWIIFLDFAASNREITDYPLSSLDMSWANVGEFFGS
jgi:hypothetical protein